MNELYRCIIIFSMALFLANCSSISPQSGFDEVGKAVQGSLGKKIVWDRSSQEDAQIRKAIGKMLSHSLTCEQTVQIALLNNYDLQALYEDIGVAQAELVQAGLLKNPVFDAALAIPLTGAQANYSLSVVMDFLDIFYIPLRKAVAAANFTTAKLRVRGAVIDLAGKTRQEFYRVQADQQVLQMREQAMVAIAGSYELARRLHEAGNITDLVLWEEQAFYEDTRLELAAAHAALAESRERLTQLMGLWGKKGLWQITSRLADLPTKIEDFTRFENKAVAASLDLAVAKSEMVALVQKSGLTKAMAILPMLEDGAEAEKEDGEWEVGPSIAVAIPIFDQGQAQTAIARYELRRKKKMYRALAIEIRSQARLARERLLSHYRIAKHYKEQVLPLRDKITKETVLHYNAMQIGAFQLIAAKRQQIDAGRRYIEALYDYWSAENAARQILHGRILRSDSLRTIGIANTETNNTLSGDH